MIKVNGKYLEDWGSIPAGSVENIAIEDEILTDGLGYFQFKTMNASPYGEEIVNYTIGKITDAKGNCEMVIAYKNGKVVKTTDNIYKMKLNPMVIK